jgi:ABC-2 type transport system permease protein
VLLAVAAGPLGWSAPGAVSVGLFAVAILLGTAAFAGLGLLLAGTLQAEATLALANALFLATLLLGGIVQSLDTLPGPLASVAGLLPGAALAETLRVALGSSSANVIPTLAALGVWAVALPVAAARTFRWE